MYCNCGFALQSKNTSIDYSKIDTVAVLKNADECFNNALTETNIDKRNYYLKDAASGYYVLTKAKVGDIYPIIQLARTYDFQGKDKYARGAFETALGINPNDKLVNYYYGDYYYYRSEFGRALRYYRIAFENGMEFTSGNTKKMAIIYEKLGDLYKANVYYKRAFLKDIKDTKTADKIREIEKIKYNNSDYYRRNIK